MPVPVFTVGEVLTAANMNAVGLWRVTSCTVSSAGGTAATASNGVITIGSGNTSVTISNAFSADFNAYKIVMTDGLGSLGFNLQLKLGATTTGYYGVGLYASSGVGTPLGIADNNAGRFGYVGGGDQFCGVANIEVINPFSTSHTQINATISAGTNFGTYTGRLANNTSYTSFILSPDSGNFVSGTIRVYGYRK